MFCPTCNMFTNNPKSHLENPWACIAVLKDRNIQLQNKVIELEHQVEELKADLHATEAMLDLDLASISS